MSLEKILFDQIHLLSETNPEWRTIDLLQQEIQESFRENQFLTISGFKNILSWKLSSQSNQVDKILSNTPEKILISITRCYAEIDHPDNEMNTRIKLEILLSIPWIGLGIASTIMSMHQPELFGIMDPRSWSVLFNQYKRTHAKNDYLRYLYKVRELSQALNCNILELDYLLWEHFENNR